MKRQTIAIIRLVLVALSLLPLLAQPPRPAAAQDPASQIILLVNQLRGSLGLPAFAPNSALTAAAQRHANWMAANVAYSHTGEGGTTPQQRANAAGYQGYVAENIVGGTNLSPQQGVVWWQNSAIHYQTMTSTRGVQIGAGFASNGDQNMYVLVVGTPSDYAPSSGQSASGGAPAQQAAPVVITPVEVAEPREDGSIVHVVQIGQTAWDIAAAYNVEVPTLLRLNRLSDDPIILPGDEIIVRPSDQPTPGPTEPELHVVEEGETAWDIAAAYDVDLNTLLAINGLSGDPIIVPGDSIIVRLPEGVAPPPTATPPTTYVVQEGQTAWAIALRYNLTLDDLLALNGLQDATILLPGTELTIRQPDPTATPTAPPTVEATATPTPMPVTPSPSPSPAPTATATLTPTPTVTPTPTPTSLLAAPLEALGSLDGTTLLGVGIVTLGVIALLAFIGIEIGERIRKRGSQ